MAIRFDHNNNNSEWMEEMQMLFNKINNRSPFGVITFIGPILSHFKNVMRSGYLSSEPTKQDQIRSFLINKCEFIGFVETFIGPSESLFFVYENEPSMTFNLKNYLLVLAATHRNPTAICYCENKQDTQNTDTKEIKLLSAKSHDFGKELDSISVELSNPNTFIQSLLKLGSFLHGKTIKFLDNPINYPPVILAPWSTPTIPMKTTVEIEEHRKNTTFDHYRQSSAQNIKINEIADDLKSGALLSTNYCFIDDENLKDLKKLLLQDQINLSIIIVNAINQAENVNGINLTSAIIDKIEYHFRDNTFHFIFNVSDNFLGGKSKLTIEVPR
ncbi:hypothetical protein, partial [Helicobacter pylori]|uniref:hypothetical protein n=1 Tax=Helicobacter pylori TaxID=210 RepID=UPI0005356ADB